MLTTLQHLIGEGRTTVQYGMLLLGICYIAYKAISSKGQMVPILQGIVVAGLIVFAAFNDT